MKIFAHVWNLILTVEKKYDLMFAFHTYSKLQQLHLVMECQKLARNSTLLASPNYFFQFYWSITLENIRYFKGIMCIHIQGERIPSIGLINTFITSHVYLSFHPSSLIPSSLPRSLHSFLSFMRTFNVYSLSTFWLYNTVLSTLVAMLYIRTIIILLSLDIVHQCYFNTLELVEI